MRNSKSGHPQRSFLGSTEGDFKQRHYMREIYLKKKNLRPAISNFQSLPEK